ncbi:hypothetical protein NPIL_605791 [Nephila pilipes]|uniref:Uncharacterized protein n=1 Tax=Nephila pilipes TaxID=299642 RepID=A0A8X6MZ68_NEPPI|nr:hypothetical protein NPIL_605791 [Nephila pilipes]
MLEILIRRLIDLWPRFGLDVMENFQSQRGQAGHRLKSNVRHCDLTLSLPRDRPVETKERDLSDMGQREGPLVFRMLRFSMGFWEDLVWLEFSKNAGIAHKKYTRTCLPPAAAKAVHGTAQNFTRSVYRAARTPRKPLLASTAQQSAHSVPYRGWLARHKRACKTLCLCWAAP